MPKVLSLTRQMMAAARDGEADTISECISAGTSPDASNSIGQTSMHVAAIWGHANVISVLLDAGADPNKPNDDGQTPMWFAVKNDKVDVVKLLLERGAKVKRPAALLEIARPYPESEMRMVLTTGQFNGMHLAIKKHDLPKLQQLLDSEEADVSQSDSQGRTPFHMAAMTAVMIKETTPDDDGLEILKILVGGAQSRGGKDTIREACDELDTNGVGPLHLLAQAREPTVTGLSCNHALVRR